MMAASEQQQSLFREAPVGCVSPAECLFGDWVHRPDIDARWGWEERGLPSRVCWWRRYRWETLPGPSSIAESGEAAGRSAEVAAVDVAGR